MSFIFDEVVNPTATWSAGYLWFANHSYGAADTHIFLFLHALNEGTCLTGQQHSVRSKHNWRELMARFRWHDYARPRALDLGQNDSRLRWCRLPRLSSPQSKRCASCSLIPKPLVRLRRETAFGRSSCPAFPKPNHKPTYELRLGLLRCGLTFFSRFGCEHIELSCQASKASRDVVHNKGPVFGNFMPSGEILVFPCQGPPLCGGDHPNPPKKIPAAFARRGEALSSSPAGMVEPTDPTIVSRLM
jgi:hypothetical protein